MSEIVIDEGRDNTNHAETKPVTTVVNPVLQAYAHNISLLESKVLEEVSNVKSLLSALSEGDGLVSRLTAECHHDLVRNSVSSGQEQVHHGVISPLTSESLDEDAHKPLDCPAEEENYRDTSKAKIKE